MTTADTGAPATGETTDEPTTDQPPATGEKDWKAEYERLQANSRKWEERAKANAEAAKELEKLREQSMTDQERAVAEAAAKARADALAEVAGERVADAIRAVAAGRVADVDALIDGINPGRFLDDNGTPDREAIGGWLDKVAPAPQEPTAPTFPDLGQGARGGQPMALNGDELENALRKAVGA